MKRTPRHQSGLTLVELMISLTLGLVLLVGIGTLFVYTNRSNRQNEMLASMQDQARFALSTLSRDLSMAGYWGGMGRIEEVMPDYDATVFNDTTASSALTAALDCGATATDNWTLRLKVKDGGSVARSNRIEFRNHKETSAITAKWRCIGGYRSGTDAVAIRRTAGQVSLTQSASASQVSGTPYGFYLMTNGVAGALVRWPNTATVSGSNDAFTTGIVPAMSPPRSFSRLLPRIYYVRDYARSSGDNTPSLCRKELCASGYSGSGETATCSGSGSSPGFYTECLAEGVEDMQITWGLDTNGDGVPDRYVDTPPDAKSIAVNAVTAQIALRMRSSTADGSYSDDKTYKIGDADAYAPASDSDATAKRYYRRVYSTTVYLRNLP